MRFIYVFVVLLAVSAGTAYASCASSAALSYDDIGYVKVVRYSLVGQQYPAFTMEIVRFTKRIDASLDAQRATRFRGTYVAARPEDLLKAVVATLKDRKFFEMRLNVTKNLYLDGPEDQITVARCGVTTTLGTLPVGGEVSLDDQQAREFFDLESALQTVIFSALWTTPAPNPSAGIHRRRMRRW